MSNGTAALTTTTAKPKKPLEILYDQLHEREGEFAAALPSHVRPEYFQRAALTSVQQNPKLLNVDRRSLFNAWMRCAADGLVPDGREAVLVIYKDRERGDIAQYQQMVQGVRKLVQQGGEITRFEQTVVYDNDEFNYQLGDDPKILHKPALADRGEPVLVYSIAQFRDGTFSREVMTVEEIDKVRSVSRSKDAGPWTQWWGEMARKTVAKRHAKSLPMSNDLAAAALARDDAEHFQFPVPTPRSVAAPVGRPRLSEQLDSLSHTQGSEQPSRRRGRPRRSQQTGGEPLAEPPLADEERVEIGDQVDGDPAELELERANDTASPPDDNWPGPDNRSRSRVDYDQGVKDAQAGRAGCLNRDIRDNPARYAEWERGYNSVANRP